MADWIEEVSQREAELTSAGVRPQEAMRVAALFANALAQADKAKRDAAARRSELSVTVDMCRAIGTAATAAAKGITPQAVRKRRSLWFRKFATVKR